MNLWGRAIAAAVLALAARGAGAQTLEEYRAFREERFAEVHRANPGMHRKVAEIKAQTAALVAAAPPRLAKLDAQPIIWRAAVTLPFIYDTVVAPRMVVVPAGEFTTGGPVRRRVRIAYPLAVSMFPVTFAEFSLFAAETGYVSSGKCVSPGEAGAAVYNWRDPGFAQTFRGPAVCVGLADAQAYAAWISRKTGQRYRLLRGDEYEFALRGGTTTMYWWGDDPADACGSAQVDRKVASPVICKEARGTVDLGQSQPNGFGLYDMSGNVASWTMDCWTGRGKRPDCRYRAIRGASWAIQSYRSDARRQESANAVVADLGFRLAREL